MLPRNNKLSRFHEIACLANRVAFRSKTQGQQMKSPSGKPQHTLTRTHTRTPNASPKDSNRNACCVHDEAVAKGGEDSSGKCVYFWCLRILCGVAP